MCFIELILRSNTKSPHRLFTLFGDLLAGFQFSDGGPFEHKEARLKKEDEELANKVRPMIDWRVYDSLPQSSYFNHTLRSARNELTVRLISEVKDTVLHATARFITTGALSAVTDPEMKLMQASLGHVTRESADRPTPGAALISIDEPLVLCAIATHCKKELIEVVGDSMRWSGEPASQGQSYELQILVIIALKYGGQSRELGDLFQFHERYKHLKTLKCELVAISKVDGKYTASKAGWGVGLSSQLGFKAKSAPKLKEALDAGGGVPFYLPDNNHRTDVICYMRVEGTSKIIKLLIQAKFTTGQNGKVRPITFRDAVESVDSGRTYMSHSSKPVRLILCPF